MLTFPEIGRGSSRTVYDLGDGTVVKVCHACAGLQFCQCALEAVNWARLRESPAREYIVPIIACGPCWVRMPKARPVYTIPESLGAVEEWYRENYQELKRWAIGGDCGNWNICEYEGKYRLHDYSC